MSFKWLFKIIGLLSGVADEFMEAASDGKITLREALEIVIGVAEELGFDIDDEGLSLQPNGPTDPNG